MHICTHWRQSSEHAPNLAHSYSLLLNFIAEMNLTRCFSSFRLAFRNYECFSSKNFGNDKRLGSNKRLKDKSKAMNKITIVGLTVAAIALIPLSATAQSRDQLQSCRNYVASVPEFANSVSPSAIRVTGGGTNSAGNGLINWQISSRRASGTCVVNRRNVVIGYQKEQGNFGNNSDVESDLGNQVRPYRARVEGGQSRELLDRPRSNAKTVARVTSGEVVIVYRTYTNDGITWLLVRGSQGQEGWINSRRLKGSGGNNNYGNNQDVNYTIGQEVRPYRSRVLSGEARELLNRPGRNNVDTVDRVAGGERVTIYRTYQDRDALWVLVKGANGQEGWINSRRLEGGGQEYGSNANVDYEAGNEVRPYRARVESGQARELHSRPDKDDSKIVDRVQGNEQVTVYRAYNDGDIDWVLIKSANGQEGWINSRRLR